MPMAKELHEKRMGEDRDELCLYLNFALGKHWQFCLDAPISLHFALHIFLN